MGSLYHMQAGGTKGGGGVMGAGHTVHRLRETGLARGLTAWNSPIRLLEETCPRRRVKERKSLASALSVLWALPLPPTS